MPDLAYTSGSLCHVGYFGVVRNDENSGSSCGRHGAGIGFWCIVPQLYLIDRSQAVYNVGAVSG